MAPEWIPKWTGVDGHFYWECLSFTYGPPKLPKWCSKVPKVIPQVVKRCILCQKYAQSEENKRTRAGKVGAGESSKNKDCGWLEWAQNSIKNGLACGTVLGTLFFFRKYARMTEKMTPEWIPKWTGVDGHFCWEGLGFTYGPPKLPKWCPKCQKWPQRLQKDAFVLKNVPKVKKTNKHVLAKSDIFQMGGHSSKIYIYIYKY